MEINVDLMYYNLLRLVCYVLRKLLAILMEINVDLMYYNLLRLVCYDTYKEYNLNEDMHPPLSEAQLRKLKQLTIISSSMKNGVLNYKNSYEAIDERYFDQENEFFQLESSNGWDFSYQTKPNSRWRPRMDAPIIESNARSYHLSMGPRWIIYFNCV